MLHALKCIRTTAAVVCKPILLHTMIPRQPDDRVVNAYPYYEAGMHTSIVKIYESLTWRCVLGFDDGATLRSLATQLFSGILIFTIVFIT